MGKIDFLASQPHYLDHLAPIWDALPDHARGTFFIPIDGAYKGMMDYACKILQHQLYLFGYEENPTSNISLQTHSLNPILVAAYGDMLYIRNTSPSKRILMMEHGTGHTFGTVAYPNGPGKRDHVSLFLSPNQYTVDKIHTVRSTPCEIIGTPKLDKIVAEVNPSHQLRRYCARENPTIAIGFHWGTHKNRPPESGSAFEHYKDYIPALKDYYKLLAYGHPLYEAEYKPFYESNGIEYTSDFFEVMRRADVCVNDLSSALYEFLVTGKPVIVLNAPWFRREIHHGIRFWDYSNVGINVEDPFELVPAINDTLYMYGHVRYAARTTAIKDLFPYLGYAARRAAEVIVEDLKEKDRVQSI